MATDLNTASERILRRLPGVGPVLAQRIVAARPFSALAQLQQVNGIGPKRYLALVSDCLVTIGEVVNEDCNPMDGVQRDMTTSPTCGSQRHKTVGLVDLNSAPLTQLLTLHGVGPKLAQRIVDARPFRRKEEVTAVRGIGLITYEKMQHQLQEIRASATSYTSSDDEDDDEKENERQPASPTQTPTKPTRPPPSLSPTPSRLCRRPVNMCDVPSRHLLGDIRASVLPHTSSKLLIASWNIRNLSKKRDAELLHRIGDILEQFDVVALQEVRDTIVLRRLKHFMPGWDYIASPLVGADEAAGMTAPWRRRAEHFAYFFRRRVVAPIGYGVDGGRTSLSSISPCAGMVRPPFIASFQTIGATMPAIQFTLVNVHIVCGDNATRQREMNQLWRLMTRLELDTSRDHTNLMLLGDFNLSPQDVDRSLGNGDLKFEPLLLSPLSTTVGDKLLDNLWLHHAGDWMKLAMESGVYRIDWAFYPRARGLPRQYETQLTRLAAQAARVQCTLELSDHCPVWVALSHSQSQREE